MIIGRASGKRILRKIWNVLAPYERASAIFAKSVRRKPVAALMSTIGPEARATAKTIGDRPKPSLRRRNGTTAIIGVVTMAMMYGATTFSTKGFCVITAASTRPIVEPIGLVLAAVITQKPLDRKRTR